MQVCVDRRKYEYHTPCINSKIAVAQHTHHISMPHWTRTSVEMHIDQSEDLRRVANAVTAKIRVAIVKDIYGFTTRNAP